MGDAIATARMDLGCEIEFDPSPLIRGERPHPASAWVKCQAKYGADMSGSCDIYYIKSVLPAGLSWDLESYQRRNPNFPATSTKYEMYDEFDFEAFRQLGWSLARHTVRWNRSLSELATQPSDRTQCAKEPPP